MAVSVHADLVACGSDLRGEGGVALDLLSDEVERPLRACPLELAENVRRPGGMRAVVEGERDAAGDAERDAEEARDRREDGRGGRRAPGGGAQAERGSDML